MIDRKINPSMFLEEHSYTQDDFWAIQESEKRVSERIKNELQTLLVNKPRVKGSNTLKRYRNAKNGVYESMRLYADLNKISGKYIGLEAAFPAEVAIILNGFIKEKLINCEKDRSDTNLIQLRAYHEKINIFDNFQIELKEGDILKYMSSTTDKFSFINLDFMTGLIHLPKKNCPKVKEGFIEQIVNAVENCADQKCILAIWSTVGHTCGTVEHYKQFARPILQQKIIERFELLDYGADEYIDNVIPIMVEMFVLQKRTNP